MYHREQLAQMAPVPREIWSFQTGVSSFLFSQGKRQKFATGGMAFTSAIYSLQRHLLWVGVEKYLRLDRAALPQRD